MIHLKKVWVRLKTVFKYFQHFRWFCKGENFDCDLPPCWIFKDHISCKQLSSIISRSILDQLATGAISLWDMIREVSPPLVVIPLTVAPSKPHLFNDDRFIHLSTIDKPFKLDILLGILCYVYKDSYQSVKDDKSGYDHSLLVWLLSCSICPFCLLLSFCFGLLCWNVHVCTCATKKVSLFRLYFWHMSSSLHYHSPSPSKEEFIAF